MGGRVGEANQKWRGKYIKNGVVGMFQSCPLAVESLEIFTNFWSLTFLLPNLAAWWGFKTRVVLLCDLPQIAKLRKNGLYHAKAIDRLQ